MKYHHNPTQQRGVTLIELMVGIAIGLLVIAVAMGALMVSRGVSGSVSDASGLQQQGAYILRTIGQQLRQSGSLYLNPNPASAASADVLSAVAFEIQATGQSGGNSFSQQDAIKGASDTVTTGFRRYQDNVFMADNATATTVGTDYLARNCIGAPGNDKTDERIESIFSFANNTLSCGGNSAAAQPIAQNVAQFQITYLVQTNDGDGSGSKIQFKQGSDMPTDAADPIWRTVQGVQVCLVLYGNEMIDLPANSSYTDCKGDSVDMTTLTGSRKNRAHLLFRNTFQLRSQGLI